MVRARFSQIVRIQQILVTPRIGIESSYIRTSETCLRERCCTHDSFVVVEIRFETGCAKRNGPSSTIARRIPCGGSDGVCAAPVPHTNSCLEVMQHTHGVHE